LSLAGRIAAVLVGAVTLPDVAWQTVAIAVAGAVLTTVLRTRRDYLPETAPAPAVVGTDGVPDVTSLPVVSEHGPELPNLPTSASITDNTIAPAIGTPVTVTVMGVTADPASMPPVTPPTA
jgi:hypothetical protein